eukprot:1448246-Prymnesium_polylepis.1
MDPKIWMCIAPSTDVARRMRYVRCACAAHHACLSVVGAARHLSVRGAARHVSISSGGAVRHVSVLGSSPPS